MVMMDITNIWPVTQWEICVTRCTGADFLRRSEADFTLDALIYLDGFIWFYVNLLDYFKHPRSVLIQTLLLRYWYCTWTSVCGLFLAAYYTVERPLHSEGGSCTYSISLYFPTAQLGLIVSTEDRFVLFNDSLSEKLKLSLRETASCPADPTWLSCKQGLKIILYYNTSRL